MEELEIPIEVTIPLRAIRAEEIGRTALDRFECHVLECSPANGKYSCGQEQALYKGQECPDRLNRGAC